MMIRKIRTHHDHPQGRVFAWMTLIMAFGISLIFPIFPNFVKTIVGNNENVSIFYAVMAIMMFIAALASTIIFKKVQRTTITKWCFLLLGLSFFILTFASQVTELTIIRTLQTWIKLFLLMTLALFVRDFANSKNLGEEEGIFYKFHNIGLFFGPLIGGVMAVYLSYESVFILAALILLLGLAYFHRQHVVQKHPAIINQIKTSGHALTTSIKDYFKNMGRIRAYMITVTLMLWAGFRTLYIPLYVVQQGYLEIVSGLILAFGILPLILMEVKVGEYADKKGIRIPTTLGFLIIAVLLFTVFISPYPILNFILLILANIGTGFVEPIQEYYLFKHLPEKDEDRLYGIYMTADPIAYFFTPAIGALILLVFPFNYLFLVFGGIIFLASLLMWTNLKHQ